MTDWREEILAKFPETYIPLTVVSDPDRILLENEISNKLRERGYTLLFYQDEAAFTKEKYSFRHLYESFYRSEWDKDKQHRLLLLLRVPRSRLSSAIPYDLWVKAKIIHLSLHTLFPQLSYPVVSELKPSEIDRLHRAHQQFTCTTPLGENASKKYVLTRVYQINPDTIITIEDLFSALLRIHYGDTILPPMFSSFLIEQLEKNPDLTELPLDHLLSSESFYKFIQSEWAKFVKDVEEGTSTSRVPFEHHLVRPLIDNLFTEKRLSPIQAHRPEQLPAWMHIGVRNTPIQSSTRLLAKMLDGVEATLQGALPLHSNWQRLALNWAETIVQRNRIDKISPELEDRYTKIQYRIQEKFTNWTFKNHQTLFNLKLRKPLIVSHICDYLYSKIKDTPKKRVALLILDGLSLDQWIVIQRSVQQEKPAIEFSLDTVYAAIPTLTSVSRQAIFSGTSPYFFEETLLHTGEDEKHWKRFWTDNNYEAGYRRGLMLIDEKEIEKCSLLFDKQVIGFVVNFVDKSIHGTSLGTASIHDTLKRWIKDGTLVSLLGALFDHGYEVYVGSDHGNIEAKGIGIPKQGVLVDQPGSRVRIYANKMFAEQAHQEYPETILWGGWEPGARYTYLFPKGKTAFQRAGTGSVTHGGISLEEIIVPFVHVRRSG